MRQVIIALLAATVLLPACKKVKSIEFDLNYQTLITIQGSAMAPQEFSISSSDIITDSDAEFASRNTSAERVDSARVTNLKLTIQAPPSQDFDLLAFIRANLTAAGLSQMQIASIDPYGDGGSKVITFSASGDVKEFIKKDKFQTRFDVKLDEDPDGNVTIQVEITVRVYARENES